MSHQTTAPQSKAGFSAEPALTLKRMIHGYRVTQMLYVAATLGIADRLGDGAQSVTSLATATSSDARSLYRLLRALAGVGVFTEDEQGRFALTPLAELLQKDTRPSLHAEALFAGNLPQWQAWGDLLHSVRTGETAFDHQFGMSIWDYRAQHPEANAIANTYFTTLSLGQADAIVAAYDFSGVHTLMDVAGGQGVLIAAVLKANPSVRGILFDQPHVVTRALQVLEQSDVSDRCQIVSGSFFDALPGGADAIMLKNIIHDWADDDALAILRNCRRALAESGRLLVIDGVIPRGNDPHPRKLLDLQMLVGAGGRERLEEEWRTLFAQAGFSLTRVIPTDTELSIIEGKRSE
jgi:O-methyltransferase domain/Dimerisation domain